MALSRSLCCVLSVKTLRRTWWVDEWRLGLVCVGRWVDGSVINRKYVVAFDFQ